MHTTGIPRFEPPKNFSSRGGAKAQSLDSRRTVSQRDTHQAKQVTKPSICEPIYNTQQLLYRNNCFPLRLRASAGDNIVFIPTEH